MEVALNQVSEFLGTTHRAILITRRRNGDLQTSAVRVHAADEGRVLISTRSSTAKARNAAREPRVTLSLIQEKWAGGAWMHVDGQAEVIRLPAAMPLLEQYYRLREGGEHPDWEQYHQDMVAEDRVILRITPTRAVRPARG